MTNIYPETIDGYDAPVIQAVENDTFQYIYSNADGGEILIRKVVDGDLSPSAALDASRELMVEAPCNGFWHGRAGVEQYVAA